jgi:hypothetical protein
VDRGVGYREREREGREDHEEVESSDDGPMEGAQAVQQAEGV